MVDLESKNEHYILSKIEEWSEKLPYKRLTINIEMNNKTLTLDKQKANPIGFTMKGGE